MKWLMENEIVPRFVIIILLGIIAALLWIVFQTHSTAEIIYENRTKPLNITIELERSLNEWHNNVHILATTNNMTEREFLLKDLQNQEKYINELIKELSKIKTTEPTGKLFKQLQFNINYGIETAKTAINFSMSAQPEEALNTLNYFDICCKKTNETLDTLVLTNQILAGQKVEESHNLTKNSQIGSMLSLIMLFLMRMLGTKEDEAEKIIKFIKEPSMNSINKDKIQSDDRV